MTDREKNARTCQEKQQEREDSINGQIFSISRVIAKIRYWLISESVNCEIRV